MPVVKLLQHGMLCVIEVLQNDAGVQSTALVDAVSVHLVEQGPEAHAQPLGGLAAVGRGGPPGGGGWPGVPRGHRGTEGGPSPPLPPPPVLGGGPAPAAACAGRSWGVAASSRTSPCRVFCPPTRRISFPCTTPKSSAGSATGSPPPSSSSGVPPAACPNTPGRPPAAPVKAPF